MKATRTKKSDWILWVAALTLLALVLLLLVALMVGNGKIEPSGDYRGMTARQALFAECEARGIALSGEEEQKLRTDCEAAQRQYAMLGEYYTLQELEAEERERI